MLASRLSFVFKGCLYLLNLVPSNSLSGSPFPDGKDEKVDSMDDLLRSLSVLTFNEIILQKSPPMYQTYPKNTGCG